VKRADVNIYRCPSCGGKLLLESQEEASGAVETGVLICQDCGLRYPISQAIPRFVPKNNYATSFGLEWQSFPKTQLDADWQQMYRERFFQTTEFPQDLAGLTVLEVGCGAGAFTGIILSTGARLFSSDLSGAIDVCRENHTHDRNFDSLSLCQADLHALPFAPASFDKVVCLGVIQHCPSPERAFHALCRHLKPGGEIVIDCYLKQPLRTASAQHLVKHAMRVVTKHMPNRPLLRIVSLTIGSLYDLKAAINRIPVVGAKLHRLIAIGELKRRDWTPQEMKQIKSMNVFDMLSPKYDNPRSLDAVRGWIAAEGLQLVKCNLGHNGINAKARRPVSVAVERV
jgi:ubiquinone/menaquinone biosynthesis C-methylase UbiE/uncharacterized protein YbaR (Trm112 family)